MRLRSAPGERGQGTVEWIALVLVAAAAVATLGALAGVGLPGAALARAVGATIACAIELGDRCGGAGETALIAAYGEELGNLVGERAPQIRYEPGMRALPVDYRRCREDRCAEAADKLRVARSLTGEHATVFTHVVDCRPGTETPGAICSGVRSGSLYLQYWLYYPGSATAEGSTPLRGLIREAAAALGAPTYHPDDWESVQYRLAADGSASVRASSHHGYGPGWVPVSRAGYRVAGGSHAGTVEPAEFDRITPPRRLEVVALEPIAAADPGVEFAVTPPWRKRVWVDPEYEGTD
jgi:hypothetical protein